MTKWAKFFFNGNFYKRKKIPRFRSSIVTTVTTLNIFFFRFFRKRVPSFLIARFFDLRSFIKFDDNDRSETDSESCYTSLFIMQSHAGSCGQILQSRRYNLEYWNRCYTISRLADGESGARHYRWLPINTRHIRPIPVCNLFRDNGGQF